MTRDAASGWGPVPDGVEHLSWQSLQLVRPELGTSLVLAQSGESGSYFQRRVQLSDDGGCVGYALEELTLVSAITGRTRAFEIPGKPRYDLWTFVGAEDGLLHTD